MACENLGLHPCVAIALQAAMEVTPLKTLKDGLSAQLQLIQAEIVALEAVVLQLDVLAAPLDAVKSAASSVLAEAQGVIAPIPFDLLDQCVDLSALSFSFTQFFNNVFARANSIINQIDRLNLTRLLVDAAIKDLEALVALIDKIVQCIDTIVPVTGFSPIDFDPNLVPVT